jgi:hypothetical protein
LLDPLQNNGGPTFTHALSAGSPAINAGDPAFDPSAFTPPLDFDQRGTGFPRVVGGRIDIGAFEVQNTTPAIVSCSADPSVVNCALPSGANVTLHVNVNDPDQNQTLTVTVTEGNSQLGSAQVSTPFNNQVDVYITLLPGAPHSLTVTASDGIEESQSCASTVTVTTDTVAPQITACAPAQTAAGNAGCQAQVPDFRSGVTATDSCTAAASLVISQTPAPGTWVGLGVTQITLTATDGAFLSSQPCLTTFTVTASTSTTVAAAAGQYSDVVTLQATVSPVTLACPITGTVEFWVNGSSAGSAAINASGVATLNYTIGLPQGAYTIHAQFTSANPSFLSSAGDNTLTVTRENGVVTPRSSNPWSVKVNTAGGTAGPITLCADIKEVADGSLGDISKAVPVTFTLVPVVGGGTITQTATVTGGGVGGTLAACVTLSSVPVNVYDITINIGGNYYIGSAETCLAVYDPSLGFVTGGGKVTHNGVPANFAFSVKYLKNGQSQGSLLYIEHRATGDVLLKSNSMGALSIVGNTAVITGKATLNAVGNHGFRATVVDNGEPGTTDQFGLNVTNPAGAVVTGLTFAPLTIDGGNIQVPQGAKK